MPDIYLPARLRYPPTDLEGAGLASDQGKGPELKERNACQSLGEKLDTSLRTFPRKRPPRAGGPQRGSSGSDRRRHK